MSTILPAIFFGHGNPMNAVQNNRYTSAWRRIGASLPKPRAILAISAHWSVPMTAVTVSAAPRTIHDFGGFPSELYRVQYPAPGEPQLAEEVCALLAPLPVARDDSWGLDHGTWSVLKHVYPHADVPVVQLSINDAQPAAAHFEIGQRIAALRSAGILIMGSGNLVHNLHTYAWGRHMPQPYDWATRFESTARRLMLAKDYARLIEYERLGADAMLAIPTPEHYVPLLYVLGTQQPSDAISFPVEGVDGGSISMLSVQLTAT
jgi:4,5-DOPA dioxygenase extradiol